ncbi:M48 family metallopeptidase [Geofilum rhodophaeum]|uniref:M48 family metallopeptidase n=1 Tax=Geofilum rhodophaeum TaxID=1965019 RepID=UPI000B525A99|nr:M48 family metallopeptidase [Geofilum rhodophaeum]
MDYGLLWYVIVAVLLLEWGWDQVLETLNRRHWTAQVPERLKDVFPEDKFQKQKDYRRVNHSFSFISSAVSLVVVLMVLLLHGFGWLEARLQVFGLSPFWHSLVFLGVVGLLSTLLSLPFSIYHTFVIEERFGFNKATPRIFVADTIKSLLLGALLGGLLLGLFRWFFEWTGPWFWLWAWGLASLFAVFFGRFYTTLILPLFNKLKPLEEGSLKQSIESMSKAAGFRLDRVYVMDGSRRSTKANAFFSGWGRQKRIVLFDTLLEQLNEEEVVAVLAHEIGHYRLKHIHKGTAVGLAQTGFTLWLLSLFILHPAIAQALGAAAASFHIGLLGFGLLFSPISGVMGLASTILSRRHEYQADAFAAQYASGAALQTALKKISAEALSNPTPHPWYVFFHYSHPPLLKRLEALDL